MDLIDIFLDMIDQMLPRTLSGKSFAEATGLKEQRSQMDEEEGEADSEADFSIEELQQRILEETGEYIPDDVIEDILAAME